MLVYDTGRSVMKLGAYIEDIIFPCSRDDLLICAEENDAPDLILDAIENLPEKKRFSCMREILVNIQSYT
jgi:hypothetical protein